MPRKSISPGFLVLACSLVPAWGLARGEGAPPADPASHGSSPAAVQVPSLIYTQNLAEGRVLYIDPVANTRVVDFLIHDALPDHCYDAQGEPSCFMLGGHSTVIDDRDYVDVTAIHLRNFLTTIARIPVAAPTSTVWQLNRLDFSGVSSNGSCTQTCGDTDAIDVGCGLGEVHEFVVSAEDPEAQWVELIITDPVNSRIEQVHLDYGNGSTCGQVQWVIDDSNPEWPSGSAWPNGMQLLHEPEGTFILTTFYQENAIQQTAGGGVILWDLNGTSPVRKWAYPDAEASRSRTPYLNAPHGSRIAKDPITGERLLLYAHSLGDSTMWGQGTAGTWGVAKVSNLTEMPVYMGEWILPETFDKLNFPRELEVLPDGTFMGTESGCFWIPTPDQPCPAAVYFFRPGKLPWSNRTGYFTSTHRTQNIVTLADPMISLEVSCGLQLLFGADALSADSVGQDVRQAAALGGAACPK